MFWLGLSLLGVEGDPQARVFDAKHLEVNEFLLKVQSECNRIAYMSQTLGDKLSKVKSIDVCS